MNFYQEIRPSLVQTYQSEKLVCNQTTITLAAAECLQMGP